MSKKFFSVLFIIGMAILCLIPAKHSLAFFVLPPIQDHFSINQSVRSQEAQEAPTQVVAPTLPVELWTQTATPGPDGYIKHTVLEHQFLWNIAELYGVSPAEIYKLNNLTEDSIIYPGDILIIKKIEEPTPEPTVPLTELVTSNIELEETQIAFEPTPELTPTNTSVPEVSKGLFERVFTNNSKYLAYGIFALVLLGIVLLIVSSRRIH
ncbi:MAG: LysM peptidoglycan-binding domain-containing protein [Chloroflexi bacterium]|nr:LysM peptidoglycan-binding domain-containing protein [Chloroflexota bacterium]